MKKLNSKMITTLSMLIAMEVVLSRFLSINAWNTKIGFSFVPIVIAAILFGPIPAAIVAGLGDFIGAILFPIGQYFVGFTITAVLTGFLYGFLLHKKGLSWPNIIAAVLIKQGILSLLLNSYWISFLYGSEYKPLIISRIPQALILTAVEFVMIPILVKVADRLKPVVGA